MPSFSIPLSGLEASSNSLPIIANNLANLNTVGFKAQRTEFQDLFYEQIGTSGNGDPIQEGVGVTDSSISSDLTQGSIQASGVPTDVAIQGNGYFIAVNNGETVYTRAGDLSVSSSGQLLTPDGAQIQGYQATNGVINANAPLGNLTISTGVTNPPSPTTAVQLAANLDSGTAVGGNFATSVTVFDSLGGSHTLTYTFTKTAANSWNYAITIPAADVGATGAPVSVKTGTLTFNGAGMLTAPAANVTGITINNFTDGANPLTFSWNVFDANNNGLL